MDKVLLAGVGVTQRQMHQYKSLDIMGNDLLDTASRTSAFRYLSVIRPLAPSQTMYSRKAEWNGGWATK